jgi:hypothetical protein
VSTAPQGGAVPRPYCITRKNIDPEKLKGVPEQPLQTDKQDLAFGLCTYYRRLILGFTDVRRRKAGIPVVFIRRSCLPIPEEIIL